MGKVFRDPVYNIINVDDDALKLVDTYTFQRLRRIRQLGVAWLVYPSAEHSRLIHSLGVHEMSKKILKALKENSDNFNIDPQKEKLIEISALLHDIGHGPFSHIIEGVIKNQGGVFEHEDMSIRIIQECNDIREGLSYFGGDFYQQISQVLKKDYQDIHVVSVISSQFDADRIDYLLRDSYMTGANYGKFDIDWLLMNISMETPTFPENEGQKVVAINYKKGLNVLEQYILGRHYMYSHVYYHKVIRSFEAIINSIIKRIIMEEHNDLEGYPIISKMCLGEINMGDYLLLDDFMMMSWFHKWFRETKDEILKDLLFRLFSRNPFKVIIPPKDPIEYGKFKDKVLSYYPKDDYRDYFFFEDTQKNVAYKDLYATKNILEEIFVKRKDNDVVPLSAIDDSIIGSKSALQKETIRWYVEPKIHCRLIEEGIINVG